MIPLAGLVAIVLVLGIAAGPLLSRCAWSHRLPKVAALAWLPTFRGARRTLPLLLEMTADEIAARSWGRETVATALRKLTVLPSPAGGPAAGATDRFTARPAARPARNIAPRGRDTRPAPDVGHGDGLHRRPAPHFRSLDRHDPALLLMAGLAG